MKIDTSLHNRLWSCIEVLATYSGTDAKKLDVCWQSYLLPLTEADFHNEDHKAAFAQVKDFFYTHPHHQNNFKPNAIHLAHVHWTKRREITKKITNLFYSVNKMHIERS